MWKNYKSVKRSSRTLRSKYDSEINSITASFLGHKRKLISLSNFYFRRKIDSLYQCKEMKVIVKSWSIGIDLNNVLKHIYIIRQTNVEFEKGFMITRKNQI